MNNRYFVLCIVLIFAGLSIAAPQQGSMTDPRDGKTYKTVKIGKQIWMAENLNFLALPKNEGKFVNFSWCYEKDDSKCAVYGRLYTWTAAIEACPDGWHLPSDKEWKTLFSFVKPLKNLKSKKGWRDKGSDFFGFSALPAGYMDFDNHFYHDGSYAYFWSSTEEDSSFVFPKGESAYFMNLGNNDGGMYIRHKNEAFSVRCLFGDNKRIRVKKENVRKNFKQELGTLTDSRDEQVYKTVKIGGQVWMAENLNYEMKGSSCLIDKSDNCKKYGRHYTWNAAMNGCPNGWHLPKPIEWDSLFAFVGGFATAGEMLKSATDWSARGNGSDVFSLTILPACSA